MSCGFIFTHTHVSFHWRICLCVQVMPGSTDQRMCPGRCSHRFRGSTALTAQQQPQLWQLPPQLLQRAACPADVSAESSPAAVTLIQPEQAVGEAQSITSTGDAGPRVQGPPVDRATQSVSATQAMLPTSDTNFQQQDAAAIQPLDLSNASADVVVPQVQGRADVHSSAAADSNQICRMTGSP